MTERCEVIEGQKWINYLYGFEETPENVRKNLELEKTDDGVIISSKINGHKYNSGTFSIKSISSYDGLTGRGGGKLHLIKGNGMRSKNLELVDILTAEAFPDFNGATFQLASNFNCLEFPHAGFEASYGVSSYGVDMTQGPTGAVAAGPAAIYRNWFTDINEGYVGQTEVEINLLKRTPIKVIHGKAIADKGEWQHLKGLDFDWSNLDNYMVGVHQNCQVLLTREMKLGYMKTVNYEQYIHQVLCSALSYGGYATRNDFTLELGSKILEAEYKATILAAWDNSLKYPDRKGSNKLFLTLIGCGSFSNPIPMVSKAIADCEDLIIKSGLDVYLMCFAEDLYRPAHEVLKDVVMRTGGTIIVA